MIDKDTAYLCVPDAERTVFETNFLHEVVAEFRFPTLLEISQEEPVEMQKAIRDKFPIYQRAQTAEFSASGSKMDTMYEFNSKDRQYLVRLTNSSLSIVAKKYESFDAFIAECEYLLSQVQEFLQTDFFTRVGMRYINKITMPNKLGEVSNWVNPSIVQYLSEGKLGIVSGMKMEVSGKLDEESSYLFRNGFVPSNDNKSNEVDFMLDFDYSNLNVEIEDAIALLNKFHETNFNFFWWSLGDEAKKRLKNG